MLFNTCLDKNETDFSLKVYAKYDLPNTGSELHMSLSISWSCPNDNGFQYIAFSDSRGFITLVNFNDGFIRSFKAHNFEAWIVTFNNGEPNILYTGSQSVLNFFYNKIIIIKLFYLYICN